MRDGQGDLVVDVEGDGQARGRGGRGAAYVWTLRVRECTEGHS